MRALWLAVVLALALPATAQARTRVQKFTCAFGDGRTHLLSKRLEVGSDDALYCWVQLSGVSERRAPGLAGELVVVRPNGRKRTLAWAAFEPRADRYQQAATELAVGHDDWLPGVRWATGRRPRLQLVVQVWDMRGSQQRRRWRRVVTASAQVGHHRVYAGTPSFKDEYAPHSSSARSWSGLAARMKSSASPASSPYDDNP